MKSELSEGCPTDRYCETNDFELVCTGATWAWKQSLHVIVDSSFNGTVGVWEPGSQISNDKTLIKA
jgi:hypothetical protein